VLTEAARLVHELDADVAVRQARLLADVVADSVSKTRLYVVLLTVFAAVALLLAGVGMYGVVSYSVSQRTHEIGVRMALGADGNSIARLVVHEGLVLTLAGTAVGLAGAWWSTQLLVRLIALYGVEPRDPIALGWGAAILVVSGLLASYLPARRAARVDPMVAVRME